MQLAHAEKVTVLELIATGEIFKFKGKFRLVSTEMTELLRNTILIFFEVDSLLSCECFISRSEKNFHPKFSTENPLARVSRRENFSSYFSTNFSSKSKDGLKYLSHLSRQRMDNAPLKTEN